MIQDNVENFDDLLIDIDRCLKEIGFLEVGHLNYKIPYNNNISVYFTEDLSYTDRHIIIFCVNGEVENSVSLYEMWFYTQKTSYIKGLNDHFISCLKNNNDIKLAVRYSKFKRIWRKD